MLNGNAFLGLNDKPQTAKGWRELAGAGRPKGADLGWRFPTGQMAVFVFAASARHCVRRVFDDVHPHYTRRARWCIPGWERTMRGCVRCGRIVANIVDT